MQTNNNLLTVLDFAKMIGVSYPTAMQMVASGQVPTLLVGKRKRISEYFVTEWVRSSGPARAETSDLAPTEGDQRKSEAN